MDVTNTERDGAERDLPTAWLDCKPTDFDTSPPMTQGSLFVEPDRLGTEPLFGGAFGEDLLP